MTLTSKMKRWQCDYPVGPGLPWGRKLFARRSDADEYLRKAYEQLEAGGSVDPARAAKVTVGQLHREHMDYLERSGGRSRNGVAGSSLDAYNGVFDRAIEPFWGSGRPLSTVTEAAVREWVERGTFATPADKRIAVKQFNRMFEYATDRYVSRNPVKRFIRDLPKSEPDEKFALSPRQVLRLAACAPEFYADSLVFLALTGLRYGELAAVQPRDLKGDLLTIRRTQRRVGNRSVFAETTKSGERRTIPLAPRALAIFQAHAVGKSQSDLVFTAPRGGMLRYSTFRDDGLVPALALAPDAVQQLQEALSVDEFHGDHYVYGERTEAAVVAFQESLGLPSTGIADRATRCAVFGRQAMLAPAGSAIDLPADEDFKDFTLKRGDEDFPKLFGFHTFRHTAVSLAISTGASVKLVQQFAGHSNPSMTLKVYAHLFKDDLSTVAVRLGRLFDAGVEQSGGVKPLPLGES